MRREVSGPEGEGRKGLCGRSEEVDLAAWSRSGKGVRSLPLIGCQLAYATADSHA